MSIPFGHHQLHNRYSFEGELELVTPLRISSGRASDETDAPFMRLYDGTLYIPGSSLRGAIRSEVERILASLDSAITGLRSCTLFEKGDCGERVQEFRRSLKNADKRKAEDKDNTDDQIMAQFVKENLCDVCRLFGSSSYASRLVFEDGFPISKTGAEMQTRIRDGVGIDRDTGAAKDGAKFDYEVIEPGGEGVRFTFRMVAENINVTAQDKKLIDLILALLKDGLFVGGKRSGGMGKVKLAPKDGRGFKVTGFESPQSLWEALVAGRELENPIEWKEGL